MKNLAAYLKEKKMDKDEMLSVLGFAYDNLGIEHNKKNKEQNTESVSTIVKCEKQQASNVDPELVPTISSLFQKLKKQMYGNKKT